LRQIRTLLTVDAIDPDGLRLISYPTQQAHLVTIHQ
jgi:hypothetical protein